MAVPIKIKWGKETLSLDVDPNESLEHLKKLIHQRTSIPVEKQKIMGLRGAPTATLSAMGLAPGKTLMLIGTPDGTVLPSVQQVVQDTDEATKNAAIAMNGIENMGNTCYLNAAVQMIRSIPQVREVLSEYRGSDKVLMQLGELLNALHRNLTEPVMPMAFFKEFCQKYPSFAQLDDHQHLMQQDSHEALTTLMESIRAVLPPKYESLFCGELDMVQKRVDDTAEGEKSRVPFSILTCNIYGDVQNVEGGLQKAFNEEFTVTEESTGQEIKRLRTSRIAKAPEYLMVNLTRFSWRSDVQKKAKVLKPISFPLTLDTFMLVSDSLREAQKPAREEINKRRDEEVDRRKRSRQEQKVDPHEIAPDPIPTVLQNESGYYELCGVISHKGRSSDSGHYIYWGKYGDSWVVFDDRNAAVVEEENVVRLRGGGEGHVAYVLLYRSRNPLTFRRATP